MLTIIQINNISFPFKKSDLLKSEYFKKALSEQWDKPIIITDPNNDSEDRTLKLFFTISSLTGEFPHIDETNCLIYFEYANYFLIHELSNHCSNYLIDHLNNDNVLDYLQISSKFELEKSFYNGCTAYIKSQIYDEGFLDKFFEEKTDLTVFADLIVDTDLWFNEEKYKYQFAKQIFNKTKNSNNNDFNSKFLTFLDSICFSQFKDKDFISVIKDKILTLEQIEKVAEDKNNKTYSNVLYTYSYKHDLTDSNYLYTSFQLPYEEEFDLNDEDEDEEEDEEEDEDEDEDEDDKKEKKSKNSKVKLKLCSVPKENSIMCFYLIQRQNHNKKIQLINLKFKLMDHTDMLTFDNVKIYEYNKNINHKTFFINKMPFFSYDLNKLNNKSEFLCKSIVKIEYDLVRLANR